MTDSADALTELAKRVSNRGRWGADDEIGTPNTITAEKIQRASALVASGTVLSLAIPLDANGPQFGTVGRFNPIRTMLASGTEVALDIQQRPEFPTGFGYADDIVTLPLQCATHWDGLGHIFHKGEMYNGVPASFVTSQGALKNGIQNLSSKVVSRGILLDLPHHLGVDSLAPGQAISGSDLEDAAREAGLQVEPGDILLVRTGYMANYLRKGDWRGYTDDDCPGLSYRTAEWLHEYDIAAVATDTFRVEVKPFELPGARSPLHLIALAHMGLLLGEIFYLEELAATCIALKRWEFLFVALPLPFTGAVGSPVNPCAIL